MLKAKVSGSFDHEAGAVLDTDGSSGSSSFKSRRLAYYNQAHLPRLGLGCCALDLSFTPGHPVKVHNSLKYHRNEHHG